MWRPAAGAADSLSHPGALTTGVIIKRKALEPVGFEGFVMQVQGADWALLVQLYFFSREAGMLPPFSAIFFKTVSCSHTFILA
jgi:hypothetical protein